MIKVSKNVANTDCGLEGKVAHKYTLFVAILQGSEAKAEEKACSDHHLTDELAAQVVLELPGGFLTLLSREMAHVVTPILAGNDAESGVGSQPAVKSWMKCFGQTIK